MSRPRQQRGAAILTAMLLVASVATMSTVALWQQWRGIEIETAERARLQSTWILQGALDWARLILREDARAGSTDHLAEPWAVALREARLSSFLATGQGQGDTADAMQNAFLSGQISDLQARLNVMNLVQDGVVHPPSSRASGRLFAALQLPQTDLQTLTQNLLRAMDPGDKTNAPLLPDTVDQLGWLGLSPTSIEVLRPYITVLPERTAVNLNTAPALVLYACIGTLSLSDALRLQELRTSSHFRTLADVAQALGATDLALTNTQHSVNTRFFEVQGRLRLDSLELEDRSVVQRDGLVVKLLRHEKGALQANPSVQ